jgi:hypothetical protein
MKRSAPSAVAAFFPLAALLAVMGLTQALLATPRVLPPEYDGLAFLLVYGQPILVAIIFAPLLWFLMDAFGNRALPVWQRLAWMLAFVFCGPFAAPLYWWLHSVRGD